MYKQILIPLDGSKTAEAVLPYARTLARKLNLPIELLGVVNVVGVTMRASRSRARHFDTLISESIRSSEAYLTRIAASFPELNVKCTTDKGRPEDVILEKARVNTTLITMATHGRSGLDRFLLGSVAEKVLRATTSPILLIRATEGANSEGEATLNSVVVPLDGSEFAESVLPTVATLAKELKLKVVLLRAYSMPSNAYADDGYYAAHYEEIITDIRDEVVAYLESKTEEMKRLGAAEISCLARDGFAAEEIIAVGRDTPDNLIAMCTHGRSGVRRWTLGSVTETVARHSGDPVLVLRAT